LIFDTIYCSIIYPLYDVIFVRFIVLFLFNFWYQICSILNLQLFDIYTTVVRFLHHFRTIYCIMFYVLFKSLYFLCSIFTISCSIFYTIYC